MVVLLHNFMPGRTYYAKIAFHNSWVTNSVSITTLATPQWIPQLFWVMGLCLFVVTVTFVTIYSVTALLQRNWDLVARIAGVPSISEVMEEETHGIDVMEASASKED